MKHLSAPYPETLGCAINKRCFAFASHRRLRRALADPSVLVWCSRLEDCVCNAISIQGMSIHFYSRTERESEIDRETSANLCRFPFIILSVTCQSLSTISHHATSLGNVNCGNNSFFPENCKIKSCVTTLHKRCHTHLPAVCQIVC